MLLNGLPRLLAVDPGIRGSGCSLWSGSTLVQAEYVRGTKTGERAEAWIAMANAVAIWSGPPDVVAIESPQTYGGRSSRGDTQDLLDLSAVVGAICQEFRSAVVRVYRPSEWKGNLPTEILWPRCEKRLSDQERAAILWPSAKSLRHNVEDGIGIGLKHLGRM